MSPLIYCCVLQFLKFKLSVQQLLISLKKWKSYFSNHKLRHYNFLQQNIKNSLPEHEIDKTDFFYILMSQYAIL